MRAITVFKLAVGSLLLLLVWILTRPLKLKNLSSSPKPVNDYTTAIERIEALKVGDKSDINPVCRVQFMTHGHKAKRAIVFWHGYTSCPHQFRQLGQIFFYLGYNVLIPRLPHHGLTDRMASNQAQLSAEELIALVDEVVDIARGLGQHVSVVGFSAGGVLAGWAAQQRRDIDQAVIISPVFWLKTIPVILMKPFIKLFLTLPNFYRWWNPDFKANAPGPQHAYPRYSSRALSQILRLSLAVQTDARRAKPAASSIIVVTNPNDWAVDNDVTADIVSHWRDNGRGSLRTYEFEAEHELGHDLIDPDQEAQRIDLVYPILVDLIENGT